MASSALPVRPEIEKEVAKTARKLAVIRSQNGGSCHWMVLGSVGDAIMFWITSATVYYNLHKFTTVKHAVLINNVVIITSLEAGKASVI